MILYTFRCPKSGCSYELDVRAAMGAAPPWVACPICFARMLPFSPMKRLFTTAIRSFSDIPPRPPKQMSLVDRVRKEM